MRASLKGPGLRARARVLVAFRRPDALRIEVPGPVGLRLVAVARAGTLTAAFPGERALFRAPATSEQFAELLGVELAPEELMDLLLGLTGALGAGRLQEHSIRWGAQLPREIRARLHDGTRLALQVDAAETGVELPAAAFEEPPHAGYRSVDAQEARRLWGGR